MKALIITWENFQDQEVVYPYYRLREDLDEKDVVIMSNVKGKFFGIMGVNMESHALVDELNDQDKFNSYMSDFDLLVLPGGVKSLEKLERSIFIKTTVGNWLLELPTD